jgi:fatty acid desaturase
MVLIGLGASVRWTIVAHHVSHGGLDRVPGVTARHHSRCFARGARRFIDWLDWFCPQSWHHEHDLLHHYHLGESTDPDLVEDRTAPLRPLPMALRYGLLLLSALTWKLSYYAPRAFHSLVWSRRCRTEDKPQPGAAAAAAPQRRHRDAYRQALNPLLPEGRAFYLRCIAPYALARFVLIPLAYLGLGGWAALCVLFNSIGAELLTNLHTFLLVVPSHSGDDLYRFERRAGCRATFYMRQVLGSVNYTTGGDLHDFLHGFLNYQIEHHLFPDLPPAKYRQLAPRVKALCLRYGLPYNQDSVWRRFHRMLGIATGTRSMRRAPGS